MKKKGLTLDEHRELGLKLKRIHDQMLSISVQVENAYSSIVSRHASRAYLEVCELRNHLDSCVCRENSHLPMSYPLTGIYYPGSTDDDQEHGENGARP